MNKISWIFILILIPYSLFASDKVIWTKNLSYGIVWQQTENGNILKYKEKTILYMEHKDSPGAFLCAYQGATMKNLSQNEQKKLKEIGALNNMSYNPPSKEELTGEQLNTLYRITLRYCDKKVSINTTLGRRWLFIETPVNYHKVFDTKLQKFISTPFDPASDIKKGKYGYFAISNNLGYETIDFLPFDGKSYIDLSTDVTAKDDFDSAAKIEGYEIIQDERVRVTYDLMWSDNSLVQEFPIVRKK